MLVHRYVEIARDRANRIIDCAKKDEQVCAYSHDAALCTYSFLVRLYVPSKSPTLYEVEVYLWSPRQV